MFQYSESFRKLTCAAITKPCNLIQGFAPDSTTYTATSKKIIAFLYKVSIPIETMCMYINKLYDCGK